MRSCYLTKSFMLVISTIKLILKNNCYPDNIVDKVVSKRYKFLKINKFKRTNDRCLENLDSLNNVMTLPYIHNLSEDIKRSLRNIVDVRFTIPKKLDTIIRKGKDRLDAQRVTEIVYKINCKDCDKVYIGQTKKHLATRIKEHKNNINNSSGNFSVVTDHRLTFNHDFDWLKPNILHKERNRKKREIAEMFYIKKFDNNINLQKDTENLNSIYDSIIVS